MNPDVAPARRSAAGILRDIVVSGTVASGAVRQDDWPRIRALLDAEGLFPLVYPMVRDDASVPGHLLADLKKAHLDALLFRDMALLQLAQLEKPLCGPGRVVIIKGLALCEKLYPAPLIRPRGDVDLYFPDNTLEHARRVLLDYGFMPFGNYRNVFRHGELVFDMHDDLWGSRRIPGRNSVRPSGGEKFLSCTTIPGYQVPDETLMLDIAAFHCVKHAFSRKIWYMDIALMNRAGWCPQNCARARNPVVRMCLEQLTREGFLPGDAPALTAAPSCRGRLFRTVAAHKRVPGAGEVLLALCSLSWISAARYVFGSMLLRKEILREIYGDHSYPVLLCRRIFALLRMAAGAPA